MIVGILQVELHIDGARSLKDKRRVVSSLKDRLHREHQLSVAEVATQENHRVATLGMALVASDAAYCQSVLDKVLDKLRQSRGFVVADQASEILSGR